MREVVKYDRSVPETYAGETAIVNNVADGVYVWTFYTDEDFIEDKEEKKKHRRNQRRQKEKNRNW